MCGIVSVKGKNATSKTIVSLKKLDMRSYNLVTPVKDQGAQGIC